MLFMQSPRLQKDKPGGEDISSVVSYTLSHLVKGLCHAHFLVEHVPNAQALCVLDAGWRLALSDTNE